MVINLNQIIVQRTIECKKGSNLCLNEFTINEGKFIEDKLDIVFYCKNMSQSKEDSDNLKNPITCNEEFFFSSLYDANTINEKTFIVKEKFKYYPIPENCFKVILSIKKEGKYEIDLNFDFV